MTVQIEDSWQINSTINYLHNNISIIKVQQNNIFVTSNFTQTNQSSQ